MTAPPLLLSRTRQAWGTVAAGAVAASAVAFRRMLRTRRGAPLLPPALDAPVEEIRLLEGNTRYYHRTGTGTPLVLLHDLHLAASAMDVQPTFTYAEASTKRPLYVPDWLGFGLSDRPDRRYVPGVYQRQLSHVLEKAAAPADIVAFGTAAVYAAAVAVAMPERIRSLLLVAPAGLSSRPEHALGERMLAGLSSGAGAYRLLYARQRTPEAIAHYFGEHLFYTGHPVPEALLDYASQTTQMPGADHALAWLDRGALDMHAFATRAFESITSPTLLLLPALPDRLVRAYDRVPEIVRANPQVTVTRLETGRMPQWEAPDDFHRVLRTWIDAPRTARRRRK